MHGKGLWTVVETVINGQGPLAILKGPRQAPRSEVVERSAIVARGQRVPHYRVRGVRCETKKVLDCGKLPSSNAFFTATSRSVLGPLSAALRPRRTVPSEAWVYFEKIVPGAGIARKERRTLDEPGAARLR